MLSNAWVTFFLEEVERVARFVCVDDVACQAGRSIPVEMLQHAALPGASEDLPFAPPWCSHRRQVDRASGRLQQDPVC